ncbi:MAG: GNAT family N-acetyltransferase, partial [Tagaea sp.]
GPGTPERRMSRSIFPTRIAHLFEHSAHLKTVAATIHREFWRDRPGYSPATFERLLADAASAERIPLCLIALAGDEVAGTANLIENDDEARPHSRPWLAAVVVRPEFRGAGVGTALVERIAGEARRLGHRTVHLGTGSPAFYARLGARPLEWARPDLLVMALDVDGERRA